MSNDCSGLPGIVTAVTHLTGPVVGAPGPWHTAKALVAGSEIAPAATHAYRYVRNLVLLDMSSSQGLEGRPYYGARGCGSHTKPFDGLRRQCSISRSSFSILFSE